LMGALVLISPLPEYRERGQSAHAVALIFIGVHALAACIISDSI
jgi:hypothetical protein